LGLSSGPRWRGADCLPPTGNVRDFARFDPPQATARGAFPSQGVATGERLNGALQAEQFAFLQFQMSGQSLVAFLQRADTFTLRHVEEEQPAAEQSCEYQPINNVVTAHTVRG